MEIGAFIRNMCFIVPLLLWYALNAVAVYLSEFSKKQLDRESGRVLITYGL